MNGDDYENEKPKQDWKKWNSGYIYVIDYGDGKTFKIGYTNKEPEMRISQISKMNVIMPMHLVMSAYIDTNVYYVEQILHMMLDEQHVRGEWFKLDIIDLCEVYELLDRLSFGAVTCEDRWYDEIVPKDYQSYLDHCALGTCVYIPFERKKSSCMHNSIVFDDYLTDN